MNIASTCPKVESKKYFLGLIIWLLAGCFFLYEFFIRAFLGSIADPLQSALSLSPQAFGLIASAYYFAYSPMQIPVGILMDRFGARIVLTCGALICAMGTLFFSHAHTFYEAWGARFLMGMGSAVGFISLLTVSMNWFPRRFSGFFAGMSQVLGMFGPILSGAPLAYFLLVTHNNWRLILEYVGSFGIILSILLAFIVRNKPVVQTVQPPQLDDHKSALLKKLKILFRRREVAYIALYAFCIYAALPLIGESFGVPYLQARGFSLNEATAMISSLWLGLGIGSPLVGVISDAFCRRKIILALSAIVGCIATGLLAISASPHMIYYSILLFLIGFATGGQTLSFALVAENVPHYVRSTAMGFNNFAVMLGGLLSQIIAGDILNRFWSGKAEKITALPIHAYQLTLYMGCLFFICAFFMSFFFKETYARHLYL